MRKLFVLLCMVILIIGFVVTAQAGSNYDEAQKSRSERAGTKAPTPVPEPVTIALLGGGLVGLYGLKKKLGKE